MMNKTTLRSLIASQRKALSSEEIRNMSSRITNSFLQLTSLKTANNLLLYAALPREVQTMELIRALSAHKKVWLPKVSGEELEIRAYEGDQSLIPGHFNVPEPTGMLCPDLSKIDLVVVPGVAFSREGDRMGYGKGFYDRLLPKLQAKKIGLAFDFQLFDSIPTEDHDEKMDIIITPKGITIPSL